MVMRPWGSTDGDGVQYLNIYRCAGQVNAHLLYHVQNSCAENVKSVSKA